MERVFLVARDVVERWMGGAMAPVEDRGVSGVDEERFELHEGRLSLVRFQLAFLCHHESDQSVNEMLLSFSKQEDYIRSVRAKRGKLSAGGAKAQIRLVVNGEAADVGLRAAQDAARRC